MHVYKVSQRNNTNAAYSKYSLTEFCQKLKGENFNFYFFDTYTCTYAT